MIAVFTESKDEPSAKTAELLSMSYENLRDVNRLLAAELVEMANSEKPLPRGSTADKICYDPATRRQRVG
jgi:hypothetical protein